LNAFALRLNFGGGNPAVFYAAIKNAPAHMPYPNQVWAMRFMTRIFQGLGRFDAAHPAPMPGCNKNQPAPTVTHDSKSVGKSAG
jgi:hypothetical protein